MADPSIEAKQELTEIGNDCVRDLGVACRSMIRNSAVREVQYAFALFCSLHLEPEQDNQRLRYH